MNKDDLIKITGQHLLFTGISTYSWTLDQFKQAAQFAKQHDVDCLLVKVFDGGNRWYGNMGSWQLIKQSIQEQGVGVIPYGYSYGNKFGALDTEIDLMLEYMQDSVVFCADLEAEYNGQVAWAQHLTSRMQGQAGCFLVSTWADPSLQDWDGVIRALAPCTTVFMPQQYSNYLASCWQQFANKGVNWLQPTINLTQDFGPNDPVQIAANAHSQKHTAISVWYYDTAIANPGLLDAVYAAFPKENISMIPQGWTDNGTTLIAPNNIPVVGGFRTHVLANNWDPANVPQEAEYRANPVQIHAPEFGEGTRQLFRDNWLWWTAKKGVIEEAYKGWELDAAYKLIATLRGDTLKADIESLTALIQPTMTAWETVISKLRQDAGLSTS